MMTKNRGRSAFWKWLEQRGFHGGDDWFLFGGFWLVDMKGGSRATTGSSSSSSSALL